MIYQTEAPLGAACADDLAAPFWAGRWPPACGLSGRPALRAGGSWGPRRPRPGAAGDRLAAARLTWPPPSGLRSRLRLFKPHALTSPEEGDARTSVPPPPHPTEGRPVQPEEVRVGAGPPRRVGSGPPRLSAACLGPHCPPCAALLRSPLSGAHVRTASSVLMDTEPERLRPEASSLPPNPSASPGSTGRGSVLLLASRVRPASSGPAAPGECFRTRLRCARPLESHRYFQECPWDCGQGAGCRF